MSDIEDTGELLIPDKVDESTYRENIVRYLFVKDIVKNKKILDAGCGTGYGTIFLANSGAREVLAFDVNEQAIQYAKQHFQHENLQYNVMSLEDIQLPDKSFDIITSFEVIEHVKNPQRAIAELKRVLKDDGVLIMSTPNQKEHPGQMFNKFHIHEMDYAELYTVLRQQFNHVRIMAFGLFVGSGIFPFREDEFIRSKN